MNHDDDFFRLPKARPPARKEPEVAPPAATVPKAPPTTAPSPPVRKETIAPPPPVPAVPVAPAPRPTERIEPKTEAVVPPPITAAPAPPAAVKPSAAAPDRPRAAPPPPPPPKPAKDQKPSRLGLWLWPIFGAGVIGVIIVGGLIGYWVFMNVAARLLITDQPLTIQLPPQADITMKTDHKIDVLMKGTIFAQVPLKQTLDLPVKGTYDTIVDIDTKVPLETVITYEGIIPVDSMADIEAKAPVNFQNVKKFKNLHFKARLPLKLRLPIKLVVPVKQDIVLRYHGPLRVTLDHVIKAPVDTVLKTALKVNQQFRIPITTSVPLRLDLPQHPVHATIVESDLNLDLATLRLERKPADSASPPPTP